MKYALPILLILPLSGCMALLVGTAGTVEYKCDNYLGIAGEKYTKSDAIEKLGPPDYEFKEGTCDVMSYYNGVSSAGIWAYAGIVPIPLIVPTGKKEDKLYFKDGQFITAVREVNTATHTYGFVLIGEVQEFEFVGGRVNSNGFAVPESPIERDWCK